MPFPSFDPPRSLTVLSSVQTLREIERLRIVPGEAGEPFTVTLAARETVGAEVDREELDAAF